MMVETCYLDDVGQGYDLALQKPEMIGTTLGRHVNDQVTSFYSWSPSKFMFEYGWGGRTIDTANWTPQSVTQGPSLWGHERMWLTPGRPRRGAQLTHPHRARRAAACRSTSWTAITCARADVCPWWNANIQARKNGRVRPSNSVVIAGLEPAIHAANRLP